MTRTIFILGFLVGAVGALAQDSNYVEALSYRRAYGFPLASNGQLMTLVVRGLGLAEPNQARSYPQIELSGVTATIQSGKDEPTNLHIAEVGVPIACGWSYCDMSAVTVVIP